MRARRTTTALFLAGALALGAAACEDTILDDDLEQDIEEGVDDAATEIEDAVDEGRSELEDLGDDGDGDTDG